MEWKEKAVGYKKLWNELVETAAAKQSRTQV